MLSRHSKPYRFSPMTGLEKEERDKRQDVLKGFKKGDPIIVGGGAAGIFIRAEGNEAIVRMGKKESKVSPMSLTRPPLKE